MSCAPQIGSATSRAQRASRTERAAVKVIVVWNRRRDRLVGLQNNMVFWKRGERGNQDQTSFEGKEKGYDNTADSH